MMIVTLIKAAAAGLTATLAASSAANMYQTFQIMQQATTASGETTSCEATTSSVVPFNDSATQSCSSVLQKLEGMKRKELLQVYVTSEAPSELASVTGEWNGILLDNNLIIMTAVSGFLTNTLFGRGRKWNGKAFNGDSVGVNRFFSSDDTNVDGTARDYVEIQTEHTFDYCIEASPLDGKPSLRLAYTRHQFPLSLWRTMRDEMRLIPCADGKVMIALGLMGWSGGIFNAQPFCLYTSVTNEEEQIAEATN